MGRHSWPLLSVLLGVVGCSGPTFSSGDEPLEKDSGVPTMPDAAAMPEAAGGTYFVDSGINPVGITGVGPGSNLSLDASTESSMPVRIDGGANWPIAVPTSMPQVVNSGGPTITAPVFQSITFADYDLTADVDDFVSRIGSTAYWPRAVGSYGIGAATSAPPVHLPVGGPQNIDDVAIQAWLAEQLTSGGPFMPPTPGAVYVIFYPSSTSITFDTEQSCFTMGAYHSSTVVAGVSVPYAVVPECASESKTAMESTTSAASHEMIEAVTDPLPLSGTPAYSGVDPAHVYFQLVLGGGEVADMCAQWPASFFVPDDLPYLVQRAWSNASAMAGVDPCQPELDGETYFNAVPVLTDTVQILDGTQSQPTMGASIAPGATRTIDVQLYSEADVGPWTVSAENVPVGSHNLGFTWDTTTGNNGDVLHLAITVNYVDATYGGDVFLIESSLDGVTNYWLGYVGQ
jgi:hypothetical protein